MSSMIAALMMSSTLKADENSEKEVKSHLGTVLETMDSGPYTYIKVDEEGKSYWIAVNTIPVEVGDRVTFDEEMWVKEFKSKSLDRTFEKVMFASDAHTSTSMMRPAKTPPVPPSRKVGPVERLADGFTVEELMLQGKQLKDQHVKLRAVVTKVSIGIMKRNWVHLEDGTGGPGSDDIVFTTTVEPPKVGMTVIAEGTLRVEKDFGYGYFYPVIVEESTFKE